MNRLPTTKLLRENIKHVFADHGIVIIKSKTREVGWDRPIYVGFEAWSGAGGIASRRRNLRKIIYDFDGSYPTEQIKAAWQDVQIIMSLHGCVCFSSIGHWSYKKESRGFETCASMI